MLYRQRRFRKNIHGSVESFVPEYDLYATADPAISVSDMFGYAVNSQGLIELAA